jgi:tetratricopeptide (TPR) repeat protein
VNGASELPYRARARWTACCVSRVASWRRNAHRAPRTTRSRTVRRIFGTAVLLLTLLVPAWARAALADPAFETANKLYEEGKFADAASAYEKLFQSGQTSVALWFNLGNALFKSGQIGRAIAAYRTAEQLAPRDPDIRANLQFARNQTQGPTLPPSRWQRWLGRLTLNEWTLLAAAAVWFWLLLLALLQYRPRLRPTLRGYVLILTVLAALLCACVAASMRQTRFTRTAIVVAPEAAAHYGPLAESPTAFTVHDGAELLVLDQKDEWLQVTAGPRRIGWLRRDQALVTGG